MGNCQTKTQAWIDTQVPPLAAAAGNKIDNVAKKVNTTAKKVNTFIATKAKKKPAVESNTFSPPSRIARGRSGVSTLVDLDDSIPSSSDDEFSPRDQAGPSGVMVPFVVQSDKKNVYSYGLDAEVNNRSRDRMRKGDTANHFTFKEHSEDIVPYSGNTNQYSDALEDNSEIVPFNAGTGQMVVASRSDHADTYLSSDSDDDFDYNEFLPETTDIVPHQSSSANFITENDKKIVLSEKNYGLPGNYGVVDLYHPTEEKKHFFADSQVHDVQKAQKTTEAFVSEGKKRLTSSKPVSDELQRKIESSASAPFFTNRSRRAQEMRKKKANPGPPAPDRKPSKETKHQQKETFVDLIVSNGSNESEGSALTMDTALKSRSNETLRLKHVSRLKSKSAVRHAAYPTKESSKEEDSETCMTKNDHAPNLPPKPSVGVKSSAPTQSAAFSARRRERRERRRSRSRSAYEVGESKKPVLGISIEKSQEKKDDCIPQLAPTYSLSSKSASTESAGENRPRTANQRPHSSSSRREDMRKQRLERARRIRAIQS